MQWDRNFADYEVDGRITDRIIILLQVWVKQADWSRRRESMDSTLQWSVPPTSYAFCIPYLMFEELLGTIHCRLPLGSIGLRNLCRRLVAASRGNIHIFFSKYRDRETHNFAFTPLFYDVQNFVDLCLAIANFKKDPPSSDPLPELIVPVEFPAEDHQETWLCMKTEAQYFVATKDHDMHNYTSISGFPRFLDHQKRPSDGIKWSLSSRHMRPVKSSTNLCV